MIMAQEINSEETLDLLIEKNKEHDFYSLFKHSNKKTLVILSYHSDCEMNLLYSLGNIMYFKKYENIDVVVVNTENSLYSKRLKDLVSNNCIYLETSNTKTYFYGKWIYGLQNVDFDEYNNIIFTEDSFIIDDNIENFLYNAIQTESEFYAYNNSSENKYHYQTYLFSIKSCVANKFIEFYFSEFANIHCKNDIVSCYEFKMTDIFTSHDCFLKIAYYPGQEGKNIFYSNDHLYYKLKFGGLLPFKRIDRFIEEFHFENFIDEQKNFESVAIDFQVFKKKTLVIIACHTDSQKKFDVMCSNFSFFSKLENSTFIVVNSTNLPLSCSLKNYFGDKCEYYVIENSKTFDFGKWIFALQNTNYSEYEKIIFTNDSYKINFSIDCFLYNALITDFELYAYNDSGQQCYHYQSFLFAIKSSSVSKFIHMYESNIENIHTKLDVIRKYELQMKTFFETSDCYLKLGDIKGNESENIYFTGGNLYDKLQAAKVLALTKVARLQE